MFYIWYRGALKNIAVKNGGVTERLESELVALLPEKLTPKVVGTYVMQCRGGQFFAVRYGIAPNFLGQLLSDDPTQTDAVWTAARLLADSLGQQEITSAIVTAALIKTEP